MICSSRRGCVIHLLFSSWDREPSPVPNDLLEVSACLLSYLMSDVSNPIENRIDVIAGNNICMNNCKKQDGLTFLQISKIIEIRA